MRVLYVDFFWTLAKYHRANKDFYVTIDGQEKLAGAVLGVLELVRLALNDGFKQIYFCEDSYPTWRKEISQSYKTRHIKRSKHLFYTDDLKRMLSLINEVKFVRALNQETQDIIALMAIKDVKENNKDVLVFSNDENYIQLMSVGVKVSKRIVDNHFQVMNEQDVIAKYGVKPVEFLYYKTLTGDKTRHIGSVVAFLNYKYIRYFAKIWALYPLSKSFQIAVERYKRHQDKFIKLNDNKGVIIKNYKLTDLLQYSKKEFDVDVYTVFKGSRDLYIKYNVVSFYDYWIKGK